MPRRPSLALGLLLPAVLATGCGGEEQTLIPQSRASQLTATVDRIAEACDGQEPDEARAAVVAANQQVSELPRRVDAELRRNLRDWLAHVEDRLDNDCKPEEKETPTPTPTPSATESPTPTPTESPEPTPTPTASPEPTEVPPEPTVEPPGNGGVPAPEDADG